MSEWIRVKDKLPEKDRKVLLWVGNADFPEKEYRHYIGYLGKEIPEDDKGESNFWGIPIKACEWHIADWCYFCEPIVTAWMPLPEPYREEDKTE